MDELTRYIHQWSIRARLQRSLALIFFGLAVGIGSALLIALLARVLPIFNLSQTIAISLITIMIAVLIAIMLPWLSAMRKSDLQWARHFDEQFHLKQRLSTALELCSGALAGSDVLRKLQLRDATDVLRRVNSKKVLPFRVVWRDVIVSGVMLIALILAIILPNPQHDVLANREKLRAELAKQALQIEEAKQIIQQSGDLTDAQKQAALDALNEAQQTLEDKTASPEDALAALNEMQSKLDALRDPQAEQRADELEQAGRSLAADPKTNDLADALANRDFDKAADEMRDLASQNANSPDQAQQQNKLADQLDQLSRGVQNTDQQLAEQLRDAAQQLREGKMDDAQKSLDKAASALQQANQQQQASQALNDAQQTARDARRAVARAEQRADGDPSDSGGEQGESAASATGEGDAMSAGEGDASAEANLAQASGEAGAGAAQQSQHSEDSGSSNDVYAPERINSQGQDVQLQEGRGVAAPNPQGRPNQAPNGNSNVPYQSVYSSYAQAADEALQNGEVPSELRDYVRDYFSSLNPRQTK